MASPRQIAANRANARKSTGPRTETGKLISRLNAVKNGLTGQITLYAPEEYAVFVEFSQKLTASLNPIGVEELHLAHRIVRDTWRLHRAAANEENTYALGLAESTESFTLDCVAAENGDSARSAPPLLPLAVAHTITFARHSRDFNLASLYEQRISRRLHKDYALFRELQSERCRPETSYVVYRHRRQPNPPAPFLREPADPPESPELSPLLRMPEKQMYYPKSKTSRQNGFVFADGPRDQYGYPLSLQTGPIVVNSNKPYVPFPTGSVFKLPPEVDCDW